MWIRSFPLGARDHWLGMDSLNLLLGSRDIETVMLSKKFVCPSVCLSFIFPAVVQPMWQYHICVFADLSTTVCLFVFYLSVLFCALLHKLLCLSVPRSCVLGLVLQRPLLSASWKYSWPSVIGGCKRALSTLGQGHLVMFIRICWNILGPQWHGSPYLILAWQ